MGIGDTFLIQTTATLIGIFVGTLAAFAIDRQTVRTRKRRRATIILRSLSQELNENYNILRTVMPAYLQTPWGKSFYISTIAWETAVSSGDLPDIIGFALTDLIADQYALLMRIRYYVDLLTRLWFAPSEIHGYEDMQRGFNRAIVEAMKSAVNRHPVVQSHINNILKGTG